MITFSRRQLLTSTAATAVLGAFAAPLFASRQTLAGEHVPTLLRAESRVLDVDGKAAKVFGLTQPNGNHGIQTEVGRRFRVQLENRVDDETLIHWHGLTPPYQQDGVPGISQPALRPGQSYDYDFPLQRAGTNWMHSHHGLQEQRLMAAPLIVRDRSEVAEDVQEVVVMLHDFTFRDPAEILAELAGAGQGPGAPHGAAQPMPPMAHDAAQPMPPMAHGAAAMQGR
ncbi:MAG: multicopper oxidase domain-containing protein, partial [Pseudomonadota bacterium]